MHPKIRSISKDKNLAGEKSSLDTDTPEAKERNERAVREIRKFENGILWGWLIEVATDLNWHTLCFYMEQAAETLFQPTLLHVESHVADAESLLALYALLPANQQENFLQLLDELPEDPTRVELHLRETENKRTAHVAVSFRLRILEQVFLEEDHGTHLGSLRRHCMNLRGRDRRDFQDLLYQIGINMGSSVPAPDSGQDHEAWNEFALRVGGIVHNALPRKFPEEFCGDIILTIQRTPRLAAGAAAMIRIEKEAEKKAKKAKSQATQKERVS